MAQLNWQVTNQRGRQFTVGVYHGASTGHLVVHCNSRVILIDFNVCQTKTYSFLLDEDLCELRIDREGNDFAYDLDLDIPDADSSQQEAPTNWNNYYALGSLIAFFLTIYLLTIWLRPYIPA